MPTDTAAPPLLRRVLSALFQPRDDGSQADVGLAAGRIVLAWIFLWYGTGKAFGWFGGFGFQGTVDYFSDTVGLHPGVLFAVISISIELVGAVALAAGFATRLAAAAMCGDMVMAIITVTGSRGFDSAKPKPGYAFNLALAGLALVIALVGAGRLSVDNLVSRRVGPDHPTG